jgi:hypothetical protein
VSAPGSDLDASRVDGALEGAPDGGLPLGLPRFAWRGPLSIQVDEKAEQQGHRVRFSYLLDVCPGPAKTTLVTHRDLHVTEIEGTPTTGPNPPKEARAVEAAASTLPTLVVDPLGNFERGSGYPEMLRRLAANFPGEDFTELRKLIDSGQAASILDATLGDLWQGWVSAWLHFDPAKGATQEVALDKDSGAGVSRPRLGFDGFTPDHHVRLHARLVPSRAELEQMAAGAGATGGGENAIRGAELVWSVETDWPEVRPYKAHSQRRALIHAKGKDTPALEDHEYTFVWPEKGAKPPKCP